MGKRRGRNLRCLGSVRDEPKETDGRCEGVRGGGTRRLTEDGWTGAEMQRGSRGKHLRCCCSRTTCVCKSGCDLVGKEGEEVVEVVFLLSLLPIPGDRCLNDGSVDGNVRLERCDRWVVRLVLEEV